MSHITEILDDRELTPEEDALIRWLLEHGTEAAKPLNKHLDNARVCSRCPCGCPSIELSIDGLTSRQELQGKGMSIVSDYMWKDSVGNLFGVFVIEIEGVLAGLEVYSIDGQSACVKLPLVTELTELLSN